MCELQEKRCFRRGVGPFFSSSGHRQATQASSGAISLPIWRMYVMLHVAGGIQGHWKGTVPVPLARFLPASTCLSKLFAISNTSEPL